MPENFWSKDNSDQDPEPIDTLLSDLSDTDEDEIDSDFFQGQSGRRRKAAFLLMAIWGITIALHLVSWGAWLVIGLAGLLWIQALRILLAGVGVAEGVELPQPETRSHLEHLPFVSLMVAAKNEEAVIGNLVKILCNLDYPADRYELWVIDDRSTDRTPVLLDQLAQEYQHLKVFHRPAGAMGGKSGALNEVLSLVQGEILAVFDADAQVPADLLRLVVPVFERSQVGAVQVRKAIANAPLNFWTRGQMAEMALDSFFQKQRIAIGGIGELRGNGQFVRRKALEHCGGWNEETITDDLDLTFRLHLDGWDIEFMNSPAVDEEGVTRAIALWHQRNRWAEGGYQRYLDYWRLIFQNRMGTQKTLDMLSFMLMQYILPTAGIPDCLMAIAGHRPPVLMPLTALALSLSLIGMFVGLRRIHKDSFFANLWQTFRGTFYMFHWIVVMASTTARMSIRRKRLKWVKTVHQGTVEEGFEL